DDRRQGDRCGYEWAHSLHARELQDDLPELDEQHLRLVHLAPALVGASHSSLVLHEKRLRTFEERSEIAADCEPRESIQMPGLRIHGGSGDRRARHLVLLGSASVHFARLARAYTRS